jgi:HEAT repeat protein
MLALLVSATLAQQKESVESLVAQLATPGSNAQEALARRGEAVIPALVKVLQDQDADRETRFEVALVLGKIGGEKVVEPLRSVINERQVGGGAIIALREVGPPAKAAVADLAKIAGAKAKPESLEHTLGVVATDAIARIGYGSKEAIDVMVARMTEKDDHAAAHALTRLGEPGAEALVTLATKFLTDERPENEKRYGDAYLKLIAGRLDERTIPILEKHVKENGQTAYVAARALANIGPRAKPLLLKLLEDKSQSVVLNAADGLSWMNVYAEAARRRQNKVEDPVSADEVFPRLRAILGKDRESDLRIAAIMERLNKEKAMALPEIRKIESDFRRAAEEAAAKEKATNQE